MALKRFIIEMGMGIDQHGQDPTVAASRAVRNAISNNALLGIWDVAGLSHPNEMIVQVQVAGSRCLTFWEKNSPGRSRGNDCSRACDC
jgi:uncharacterized protein (TIGR02058 family)